MKVEKIAYRRLYEEVLDQLAEKIRCGELAPGAPLPPERELAAQFGVSRGTLREAFRIMENNGLIESKPGGGRYVSDTGNCTEAFDTLNTSLQEATLADLMEFRLAVEPHIAELAAARITPDEMRDLERAMAAMQENEGVVSVRGDSYLHMLLAESSHNIVMIETIKVNLDLVERFRDTDAEHNKHMIDEHTAIVKAVLAHDGEAARKAMYTHLNNAIIRRNIRIK